MAEKGDRLVLNITAPNMEGLRATHDPVTDSWTLHVNLPELSVDEGSGGLIGIDFEHHEIHEGDHYFLIDVADLAINNVFDMQFTTPNTTKRIHFVFELSATAEVEWYIYEGASIVLAGTSVTPLNNDRDSSNSSECTVATITNNNLADANADTDVSGATQIAHGIVGEKTRSGGNVNREREIILKANTVYCMRGVFTAAAELSFVAEWYEHAP